MTRDQRYRLELLLSSVEDLCSELNGVLYAEIEKADKVTEGSQIASYDAKVSDTIEQLETLVDSLEHVLFSI